MTLGLSLEAFTRLHVALSLVGIVSGLIVLFGLIGARRLPGWTALYLVTTILTSVTGFGFPFDHLLLSHKVGIVSLVVLAITVVARYGAAAGGAPLLSSRSRAHRAGAEPDRGALRDRAGRRARPLHRPDRRRDQALP